MEHQKILNLLNEANDSKFIARKEALPTIVQMQTMVKEIKLSIIQKFWNLIFMISTMLTF